MREDLHINLEIIFQEVLKRRQEQGAFDQEAFNQFVEDVLEEKLDLGELNDDNNIEEWTEQLQSRWNEVEELDAEKEIGGEI